MMSDLKEQTDGKWICFAPLPVRELVHLLYNMVCEKKGKFPLSLDKVEDILNRGGHGSIKDSFGNIRELSEDWIDEINGISLKIKILNGRVEVSQFEDAHNVHVDDDEIYELKRRYSPEIPSKDARDFVVKNVLTKEI